MKNATTSLVFRRHFPVLILCCVSVIAGTSAVYGGSPPAFVAMQIFDTPTSLSASGLTAVGFRWNGGGASPLRWDYVGGAVTLPSFDGDCRATCVSRDGSVCGGILTVTGSSFGNIWNGATLSFVPQGSWSNAAVEGISGNGRVAVGCVLSGSGESDTTRWIDGAGPYGLGPLPGVPFGQVPVDMAVAASVDGSVIVGTARNAQFKREAFRWTGSGGMKGLGALVAGGESWALAVSENGGIVVGAGTNSTRAHAFERAFYFNGRGINPKLVMLPPLSGLANSKASAISADGTIIVGTAAGGNRPVV